jgi:nitroimidazol reductase NimA-like FMN-containing flavoprotein (pyridoxamine 5'-phosphate oxidase superfamily)
MSKPDLKLALKDYEMTAEELYTFLTSDPPKYAAIGSLRKTGSPIVDGIGYEWDGEDIHFSMRQTRAMVKRLRRDNRVCLHVMNIAYPVMWARIEGRAEQVEDPGFERTLRIMHRYMAPESTAQDLKDFNLEEFDKAYVEYGRTMYRVRPEYIHSHDSRKQAALYELSTGKMLDPGA